MSEIQVTLSSWALYLGHPGPGAHPPVWAEYLKQAAEAQGTGFSSTVRSILSSHIEVGKAAPTPSRSSKRCTLRFPTEVAQWWARQGKPADAAEAVPWSSYLSTLTSGEHDLNSSLEIVGLRLPPGEEIGEGQ